MEQIRKAIPLYNCCTKFDTVSISRLIENMADYWIIDSLGANGYRKISSVPLRFSKVYDVDYSFVKKNFGNGLPKYKYSNMFDSDNKTHLVYEIFNTNNMGNKWEKYNIVDKLVFEFDKETEKLVSVFVSGND